MYDYEAMVWGLNEVRTDARYLGALRLRYALAELDGVSGKVLEVGCGGGGMARALKHYRPDLDVYGCDISLRAVTEAIVRSKDVQASAGAAEALPFKSGEFRAVLMFDVLEHLENPARAIAEASRVLGEVGVVHASVPLEGEVWTIQGSLRRFGHTGFERTVGHIQAFEAVGLQRMFIELGLRNLRIKWSGHIISQLAHTAYVFWLRLRNNRQPSMSVESYLATSDRGYRREAVRALKNAIAAVIYYESVFLQRSIGAIAHLTAEK